MHFAVIGLSHVHVLAMTQALLGVPGVVCDGFSPEETPVAGGFAGLFPDLPRRPRDDLLGDPGIDLILCADVYEVRLAMRTARSFPPGGTPPPVWEREQAFRLPLATAYTESESC